jgi:uncharacterized protein (TIGR02284 family)
VTTEDTIAELNGLIETCKNGELGYRGAAADVRNTELESVFNEYSKQRGQFAHSLQAEVERLGGKPEQSGSLGGTVARGWMDLKSALSSGSGVAIIASCESAELAAMAAFDWVVNLDISGHTRVLVEKQAKTIRETHARLLRLKEEESEGSKFQKNDE